MKMKKIAAILTALSVFSGCAGNVATEEAATTTGTTEVVTAETTTTTTEVVTEAENTEAVTVIDTRNPVETFKFNLNTTEAVEKNSATQNIESNGIIDENVEHIELTERPRETDYTEFESLAILMTGQGINTFGRHIKIYFPKSKRSENPDVNIVDGWGCYPCAIVDVFKNSDSVLKDIFIDLTSSSPEELYKYIDKGTSVMVWVTEGLAEPVLFAEYEGNKMYSPKECVVLAGYSDTAVCVWSVIEGKYVTYDRALFEQRYAEMGSMALTVVIE